MYTIGIMVVGIFCKYNILFKQVFLVCKSIIFHRTPRMMI